MTIERLSKRQNAAATVAIVVSVAAILAGMPLEWVFLAAAAASRYLYYATRYLVAMYESRRTGKTEGTELRGETRTHATSVSHGVGRSPQAILKRNCAETR